MLPPIRPYRPNATGTAEVPDVSAFTPPSRRPRPGAVPVSRTPEPTKASAKGQQAAVAAQMAARVVQPQRPSGKGYDDLLAAFHRVVDHTAAAAAAAGASPQAAFSRVARYLDAYKHDTLGEDVAETCAAVLRRFDDDAAASPTTSAVPSAAVVATRPFAQGALVVLDQLLSALDEREPALADAISDARRRVHRLVFADLAATDAPDDAAAAGAPAACFKPNGLPKLLRRLSDGGRDVPTFDAAVVAELNAPFHGRRTYAEATARLVDRMKAVKKQADAAVGRLNAVRIAGRAIARERCQRSLQRAFVGWRGVVALGRAYRRFDSEAADQRERIQKVEVALTRVTAKRSFESHANSQHLQFMRDELRLMRHQNDAFRLITDRSKGEAEELRRQVHDLQRGAVLRLQHRINDLEGDLEQWRSRAAAFAHDTALNPWECYNRWRVASIAFPNGNVGGGGAGSGGKTPAAAARGRGAVTPANANAIDAVPHPPIGGCDTFKAVAIAEALANPFVGLTGGSSAGQGAPATARTRACFHAVTAFVVVDLLTLIYAMSPGHITLAEIRKFSVTRDEAAAAKKLQQLLSDLGVNTFGVAAASLPSATKPLLELIVALIVARFAGVGATCALLPPPASEIAAWCELVKSFGGTPFANAAAATTPTGAGASNATVDHAVNPSPQDDLLSPGNAMTASHRPPPLAVALSGQPLSNASFMSPKAGGNLSPQQQQQQRATPWHANVGEFVAWSRENASVAARWRSLGLACVGDAARLAMEAAETPPDPPLTAAQAAQVRELRSLRVKRLRDYPLRLTLEEIEALQNEVLAEPTARALRRVFVFYATGGAGKVDFDARMSLDEFQRLIDDSRLLEPAADSVASGDLGGGGMKQQHLVALFHESIAASAAAKGESPGDAQMTPPDFIEWIVRTADARRRIARQGDTVAFDKASAPDASAALDLPTITADDARTDGDFADPEHGLKAAMQTLVEHFILRNCSGGSSAEGVGRMLRSAPVAEYLAACQPLLRRLFRVYAAADSTSADPDLSAKEFLKLCADAGLLTQADAAAAAAAEGGPTGGLFSSPSKSLRSKSLGAAAATSSGTTGSLVAADVVHQVYYRVLELMQYDGSPTGSAAGGIRLASFKELVCALSLVVTPSPFTAFHHKLRALVDGFLRPLAATMPAEKKGGKR